MKVGKKEEYLDVQYEPTRTTEYVQRVMKFVCWCGSPNFWFEELDVSPFVRKYQWYYAKSMPYYTTFLMFFQFAAFGTQKDLEAKMHSDLYLFCGAFSIFFSFVLSLGYYTKELRLLLWKLMVEIKMVHNDREVEDKFLAMTSFYLRMYGVIWSGVLLFYGVDCLLRSMMTGDTFVTMLTAWPAVEDRSLIAVIARVFIYLMFIAVMMWFSTTYVLSIPVTVGLSHQYMNLGKYFESLNTVFEGEGDQHQKEIEYERKLKIGIKCHADTMWCVSSIQEIFSVLNGGQIFLTTLALIMLMYQYTQTERTIAMAVSLLFTATSVLLTTGCLMWKAGDVTFEAANIPTAMFCSGWQNCTSKASRRVRPLLVISMACAQIPVELKGLGLVSFSYDSYVSIVKSSYTVFSVLY